MRCGTDRSSHGIGEHCGPEPQGRAQPEPAHRREAVDNWALHHHGGQIIAPSGDLEDVHRAETGAPQRNSHAVQLRKAAREVERSQDVLAVSTQVEALPWQTFGVTGLPIVERQRAMPDPAKCCSYWASDMVWLAPNPCASTIAGCGPGARGSVRSSAMCTAASAASAVPCDRAHVLQPE